MFYYKITDTSDGSEQFLKPSEARRFLSLEDDALKAYADMGAKFGRFVINKLTAEQALYEKEELRLKRQKTAEADSRREYIAEHGASIWCGYLLFAAKFLNRMPAAVSDVNIRTFGNADLSGITMPMIAVYRNPADYPGWFVARVFDHGQPLNIHIRRRKIEEIHADIIKTFLGMIPFAPGAEDDSCIVETWV
nr:MAG TPA: hypothetical protein [Caudoviricetes sp.]